MSQSETTETDPAVKAKPQYQSRR